MLAPFRLPLRIFLLNVRTTHITPETLRNLGLCGRSFGSEAVAETHRRASALAAGWHSNTGGREAL